MFQSTKFLAILLCGSCFNNKDVYPYRRPRSYCSDGEERWSVDQGGKIHVSCQQ